MRPVLVGYGHAGRDLHHRTLSTLGLDQDVLVVDPVRPRELPPRTRWVPDLAEAVAAPSCVEAGVFHVLTPVDRHLAVTQELVEAGATRIVLEKPITSTLDQALRLRSLVDRARVLPVGVWPASRVTARVLALVADGRVGRLHTLHMEQSKPRFRRSTNDRTHRSAWEVELPHQLLLALHVAGAVEELVTARTWSSPLGSPLGGAEMVLRHAGGVTSTLVSDLTSPVRVRRLHLAGTRGEIVADYPISAEDDHGQIRLPGGDREVLADAPLTRFVERAYSYFAGQGPPPPCPLADHVTVMSLLDRAAAVTTPRSVPC